MYVSRDDQFVTQLPIFHLRGSSRVGGYLFQTCTIYPNFSQTQPDIFANFLHIFIEVWSEILYWWTSFPFFHFESCEISKLSEIFFYFQVSIHVVFNQKLTFSTCVTTFTCSVMTDNINSWLATRPDELQQHHITLLSWHKTRVPDFCVKILIKQGERKKVGEIFYFILTLGNGNLKIWTSIKITQL